MKRGLIVFSVLPLGVIYIAIAILSVGHDINPSDYATDDLVLNYTVINTPSEVEVTQDFSTCYAPIIGKSFLGFKEAIAFKESRGDYFTVNSLGYLGKYQFGKGTLKLIGVYSSNEFLNDPELQEKAFIANTMRNKWILRREIKQFVGETIDGVMITESGILAAAHLAGPGSVKKYLRSYGAIGFTDAYGTTIRYYMKRFAGYDTTFIKPERKAKVNLI